MSWSWFGGSGSSAGEKPPSSDTFNDTNNFHFETVQSPRSSVTTGASADFQQQVQQQVLLGELQKRIGHLSGVCWEKCMSAYPKHAVSAREETCISNCADRYMDVSVIITEGLTKKLGAS